MTDVILESPPATGEEMTRLFSPRQWLLILAIGFGCGAMTWFVARAFDVPQFAGYSASLLQQPSPGVAMLVAAVMFLGTGAIATVLVRTPRAEVGLVCAGFALLAISLRGGPMRYTLMAAHDAGVYRMLLAELALLGAVFLIAMALHVALTPRRVAAIKPRAHRLSFAE